MALLASSDLNWTRQWESLRVKGKTYFILRGFILQGLSVGLVAAVLAAFIQRIVGETNSDSVGWAFPTFLFVSCWGVIHTWWLWHSCERRYRAIHSRNDS